LFISTNILFFRFSRGYTGRYPANTHCIYEQQHR
jgi:hypothetical protein